MIYNQSQKVLKLFLDLCFYLLFYYLNHYTTPRSFFDSVRPLSRAVTSTTATPPTTGPTTTTITATPATTTTTTTNGATTTTPSNNKINTRGFHRPLQQRGPSGRASQPVQFRVDNTFPQKLAATNYQKRLPNSVSHRTTSHVLSNTGCRLFSGTSAAAGFSNTRFATESSNRNRAAFSNMFDKLHDLNTRLLQLNVCDSQEERGDSTSLQPQTSQPVRFGPALQDGDAKGSVFDVTSQRLHDFHRPFRCISSHSSARRFQAIPAIPMEIYYLPVAHHSFWSLGGSMAFYQNYSPNFGMGSAPRSSDLQLFRRLDHFSTISPISETAYNFSVEQATTPGMESQFGEVDSDAHSRIGTPRLCVGYDPDDCQATREEVARHPEVYTSDPSVTSIGAQSDHASQGSNLRDLSRSAVHSAPSSIQELPCETGDGLGHPTIFRPTMCDGVEMVAQQPEDMERPVGLQLEATSRTRLLDRRRVEPFNQLARVEGCATRLTDLSQAEEHNSPDPDGQHNLVVIHQQARGDEILGTDELGNNPMEMVPAEQSVDPSTAHSRGTQRRRRSRVTEDLHQEHLASSTFCIRRDTTTMGPLFGRSIRGSHLPPPTKIRVLDTGSWGNSHRRVHDDLEQLVQPLDQSTMEPDHPSSQQDFTGTASGCHDGGSVLAKCSLVSDDSGDGNFSSSVLRIHKIIVTLF
ncbi:hypothetical protein G6F57_013171 [Rhizopus arrhizus]|uniref:Uncharacterized protein n=1 Tax=Rhizopus oryzae TaxID=64495 RepID=A0A9P7BLM1_RHIOR|nr:hypothetical protein G6F30_012251 [Rhizopus arrhizus]KAG0974286.1 hypothetical protein G6F29_012299 [Rhizopus arrhizus]KAG0978061.1 hypothetical protein G6F28_012241 [Rhizopus arrhizus]KAG1002070.1 hypothetical protein G6F27_012296 [Rhizopus arrhizus]KAG1016744.1 hypothetical protein G6F26_012284 [Rhizopus arrhizus]